MDLVTSFQKIASQVGKALGPGRDALAEEYRALREGPQPAYVDLLQPPPPSWVPRCSCEHCQRAGSEAQEARTRYGAHTARLEALRVQLWRMTYGSDDERDQAGADLARLRSEIRRARETNATRQWGDLETESLGRGKTVATWVSPQTLAQIDQDLGAIGQLAGEGGPMLFMTTRELQEAIATTRPKVAAIVARPVRTAIDAAVAERANIPRHDPLDDSGGLVPGVRSPSILEGDLRFTRRR